MARTNLTFRPKTIVPQQAMRDGGKDRLVPILISACLHLVLILALALWLLPPFSTGTNTLSVAFADNELLALETMAISIENLPPLTAAESQVETADAIDISNMAILKPNENLATARFAPQTPAPEVLLDQSVSTSSSIEGAVDQVTAELSGKLQQGDLLVVWLLDASQSLVDDRQRVAERLTPFYESLVGEQEASRYQLVSAVVSYGAAMRERVAPTQFGDQIVERVKDLPIDKTGKENVFEAVRRCAEYYRQEWRDHQIAIVVWTDESGDDVEILEDAIRACHEQRVSVSVVGPTSVLGADTGLHSYTDPETQATYQLPVRLGPETALPERIELGYWYQTRVRGGGRGRGGRRELPSWIGGQDLEGILSGFSPYALTRLAMQTRGSYTIFDRPEDRGPFDPMTMRRYAPSYGSLASYETDINSHPLRTAIMKAVDELKSKNVDTPPMRMFVQETGPREFDYVRLYYSPQQFRNKLRGSRRRLTGHAKRYSRIVESALRHVSSDDTLEFGLDELYQSETSPRWQAWYNLTRGRLLATSVRLEEYRLTVEQLDEAGALNPSTNYVTFVASGERKSDGKFNRFAEDAESLLRRCVEENRGTPWETLAQRELDFALGVSIRERSLTPEPMAPATKQPNLPRF